MTMSHTESGGRQAGHAPESRGWYAWNDLMPPRPNFINVIGEVLLAHPGVHAELLYRSPQGINPSILLLDLRLTELAAAGEDPTTWKTVRYHAVLGDVLYTQCVVFLDGAQYVVMDVDTVQLAGTTTPTRAMLRSAPGQPPLNAFSGDSPFPWFYASAAYPICLSGGLSTIQFDICMDGVRFALSGFGGRRVRVRGVTEGIERRLEEFADKRVVITVCGHMEASVEHGCQYLAAERVEPAEVFANALRA